MKFILIVLVLILTSCSIIEERITISQVVIFDEEIFTMHDIHSPDTRRGDMAVFALLHVRGLVYPVTLFGKTDEQTKYLIHNIGRTMRVKDFEKLGLSIN